MLRQRLQQTQKRLIQTVILSSAIPAFLVAVGALVFALAAAEHEFQRIASEKIQYSAEIYAREVQTRLQSALTTLDALAAVHVSSSTAQVEALFAGTKDAQDWLDGLAVVNKHGQTVFSSGSPGRLPAAILTSLWQDNQSSAFITPVYPATAGPAHFFLIRRAQVADQQLAIYLSANAVTFSSMLDNIRLGRAGEVFLINRDGILQTRSVLHGNILDKADQTLTPDQPDAGTVRKREWKGTTLWYAVSPVATNPEWMVVAQRDELEILQAHDAWTMRLTAAGVAGLALLIATVALSARKADRIQRKIEEEQALLADQQAQVQKLDAISQLGVGIAHEVNNPLAIIGEEAGWMQDILKRDALREVPGSDDLRNSLRQISMQVGRCREITLKLLSFGGKTDGIIRDVDINPLVSDTIALRRREISQKNIEIEEIHGQDLPVVHTEPALLRQLLLNLINNAMDSMPDGGRITIATRKAEQGGVILTVQDTGFGIAEENLHRLFEPFFTTKPPGKGAGLGLSICHGILQRIGGEMYVTSTPGQGSSFTVEIPITPRQKAVSAS